jgi:hypothetical protein
MKKQKELNNSFQNLFLKWKYLLRCISLTLFHKLTGSESWLFSGL